MKRKYIPLIIIFVILIIGIGYAYLNTNLNLENNVNLNALKRYTVTFDYNDGVTESTTKTVTYGKEYGSLPTPPEREGYTFKGWNGKNKLALPAECSNDTKSTTLEEMFHLKAGTYTYSFSIENATSWRPVILMKNYNGEELKADIYKPQNAFYYNHLWKGWLWGNNITIRKFTITIIEDCYTKFFVGVGDTNLSTIITNSQLEEGDTATEYEPYYIQSDTIVVQDKNHTLTAIWEEDSN